MAASAVFATNDLVQNLFILNFRLNDRTLMNIGINFIRFVSKQSNDYALNVRMLIDIA